MAVSEVIKQAKLAENNKKWNAVFANYEQYKLTQARNKKEILSLTKWLILTYTPHRMYFRNERKDKANG